MTKETCWTSIPRANKSVVIRTREEPDRNSRIMTSRSFWSMSPCWNREKSLKLWKTGTHFNKNIELLGFISNIQYLSIPVKKFIYVRWRIYLSLEKIVLHSIQWPILFYFVLKILRMIGILDLNSIRLLNMPLMTPSFCSAYCYSIVSKLC